MIALRGMCVADLAAVMRIQSTCYAAAMLEAEYVFHRRLEAFPDMAWVAHDAHGVCAYLAAYRAHLGNVTPLEGVFERTDGADCLYLHDLAVSARAKGQGVGPRLVRHAFQYAREHRLVASALVAVQGSQAFWRKLGYCKNDAGTAEQCARLATYGTQACYMTRNLVDSGECADPYPITVANS